MTKSLSKSVNIMFIFDLLTFLIVTTLVANSLGMSIKLQIAAIILTVLSGIIVLFLKANYKIREFNINLKNAYLLFEGIIFAHIPTIIMLTIFVGKLITLKFALINIACIYLLLYLYRMIFHIWLFNFKRVQNVLIVGTDEKARDIANEIVNKKALMMEVVGFFEDVETELVGNTEYKIFKKNDSFAQIVKENDIDIVIIAITERMEETLLSNIVFGVPNRVKVYRMPDFYEMVTGKLYVDKQSINKLFYDFMNRRSYVYDFCKRAYDIIAALIILAVTFPVLIYIAIRIKKTDGGSPIYTQNRVARGGKVFKAYKLRTMYMNDYVPSEGNLVEVDTNNPDDRVIPFCKFVRKARLDEIPQMINILKGEMSIVGPRTEWEDLVKIYSNEVSYYPCRQWVRTGWTGWAQINQGHCISSDDIAEKLQYDLYYLKNRNVLWEIFILVKAVFMALGGRHD